jgi:hypothetical protein
MAKEIVTEEIEIYAFDDEAGGGGAARCDIIQAER